MGFFSSIFGTPTPSEAGKFDTLRDDGVRAMQMGELPYAEKCFKAALEIHADDKVSALLAEAYLRMRNYEAALPLLENLCSTNPDALELHLLLAQTQGELQLFAPQHDTCAAILALHPEEPRALYLAAEADFGLDNPIQAIARLTQSLTLRPDYHTARLLRARVLAAMEQWNEALADADELVRAEPENEDYLYLRAQALSALGRTAEAVADLEALRVLNPFNESAVLLLGALYEQTTRWDKALALYDEAIDLQPGFAAAYKARGGVKHHLKDEAGAAEDLKRSLELAPETSAQLDGQYTNVENEMNAKYRSMNPYGF